MLIQSLCSFAVSFALPILPWKVWSTHSAGSVKPVLLTLTLLPCRCRLSVMVSNSFMSMVPSLLESNISKIILTSCSIQEHRSAHKCQFVVVHPNRTCIPRMPKSIRKCQCPLQCSILSSCAQTAWWKRLFHAGLSSQAACQQKSSSASKTPWTQGKLSACPRIACIIHKAHWTHDCQ